MELRVFCEDCQQEVEVTHHEGSATTCNVCSGENLKMIPEFMPQPQ